MNETKKIRQEQVAYILDQCQAEYWEIQHTLGTACAIHYHGFILAVEYSACISIDHFDSEIEKQFAYERAIHKAEQKIWEILGCHAYDPFNLDKKD
ncbi:MAG: hypothetical protein GY804_02835 [Alphaproteobacteria bacterium]|nr:hypothetical protein [Alphaproteobacteria bacterium]